MIDTKRVRTDFSIYNKEDPPIFLDSACQTLRPRQVIDAILEYYEEYPVCSGRSLYRMASRVLQSCEEARDRFANFIQARDSKEIVFTKNTTEGINIVLFGKKWNKGDEIVCSDREHNSALIPLIKLAEKQGVKIKRVESQSDDEFDLERLKNLITDETKLVVMCHKSNVTGCTIPAREVAEIAHDHGAELLLDAAQSVPHMKIDVEQIGTDYLSFSAHKMCGPSGMGILYGRSNLLEQLEPIIYGGMTVSDTTYDSVEFVSAPYKFEAGLQNYAGIIGAGAAVKYLQQIGMEEIEEHITSLSKLLADKTRDLENINVLPPSEPTKKIGIFSFNINGYDSHDIANILDLSNNVLIRSGQHCCHSWFHARNINGCARASLYFYNNGQEIDRFIEAIEGLSNN